MNWITRLFGGSYSKSNASASRPTADSKRSLPSGQSWYCVTSSDNKIHQAVISLPVSSITSTDFGIFFLKYDRFPMLASQPWCAGLFRLDGNPGPFLMVRVGNFAKQTKQIQVTLGLSFCQMPSSGLFHMAVRFDSKDFRKEAGKIISALPPIDNAVAEWITSLDADYDKRMISDALARSELRLVVCENSSSRSTVFDPSGRSIDMVPPQAAYDMVVRIEPTLAAWLKAEWQKLVRHHETISAARKNFGYAQQELATSMPTEKDPIILRA